MPHSWDAYEVAKQITVQLVEGHLLRSVDDISKVQGIIQITLEDNYKLIPLTKELNNDLET